LDSSRLNVPIALFLGGLDPSGGAGILRDAVTASGLGVHPMAIPVAETAQNGFECAEITPPSVNPLVRLNLLKPHLRGTWGLKLSMFYDCSLLQSLLPQIHQSGPQAAIWDPIIAPTNGVRLHSHASIKEALGLLSNDLWLASPNIPEARLLADFPERPLEDVAKKLMDLGMKYVWIRGGHCDGESIQDLWCDDDGPQWLTPHKRLDGSPRGTGCAVTSAWLALRLNGMSPMSAAEAAIQYIRRAWSNLHIPGKAGRPTFPPRVSQ